MENAGESTARFGFVEPFPSMQNYATRYKKNKYQYKHKRKHK